MQPNSHSDRTESATNEQSRRWVLRGAGTGLGALAVGGLGTGVAAASTCKSLSLGHDRTFTQMNKGDTGSEKHGVVIMDPASTAKATPTDNKAEVFMQALSGIGRATRFAQVGRCFKATGCKPRMADITSVGHLKGAMRTTGDSGASVRMDLLVEDHNLKETSSREMFETSSTELLAERSIDTAFDQTMALRLEPGHRYTVWARLTCTIETLTSELSVLPKLDFKKGSKEATVDHIKVEF